MRSEKTGTVSLLVILIALGASAAALAGILSDGGSGSYLYPSIRGENITIYGQGIYRHMSADVAIQGIAQDWITLCLALPSLLVSLLLFRRGSLRGLYLLSGTLGYFLVTYLFYTAMGMYNELFLLYVALLCASFFAFVLSLFSFTPHDTSVAFASPRLLTKAGIFLIADSCLVALLWLGVVIPPLLDGSLYPAALQHYTTLIVQGFDLGLLLPMGIVSGGLALRGNRYGYLFTTIYTVFLTIMMTSLSSKILFMARAGENVIPVIFIMPAVALVSLSFSVLILGSIRPRMK